MCEAGSCCINTVNVSKLSARVQGLCLEMSCEDFPNFVMSLPSSMGDRSFALSQ